MSDDTDVVFYNQGYNQGCEDERARIIAALREPSNDLVELVDTAYRGDGWDGSFRRAISAVAAWLENSHAKAT